LGDTPKSSKRAAVEDSVSISLSGTTIVLGFVAWTLETLRGAVDLALPYLSHEMRA
jgi:hypothetical protein